MGQKRRYQNSEIFIVRNYRIIFQVVIIAMIGPLFSILKKLKTLRITSEKPPSGDNSYETTL